MIELNPLAFTAPVTFITDSEKFNQAITLLKESLFDKGATLYCADNIITWNKNLSFLRDPFFLQTLNSKENTITEKRIIWRTYILLHFAEYASNADGDFLELGCHTGHTAFEVLRYIDLAILKKQYYLYDLFKWEDGDEHSLLAAHKDPQMYEKVLDRFSDYDYVHVIKGSVPESFDHGFPEKIAFAHIDMNHPAPESAALERLLPRLSSGGVVVFDDYGWWTLSAQKVALDSIALKFGLTILEIPTGQGLLIKP